MATATLDFNNLFPATYVDTQVTQTSSILEDGFELGGLGYTFFQFYSFGSGDEASAAYDGPGVIYNPGGVYQPTTVLTRPDGTPFDIQSIKLDYAYTNFTTPRPAVVTFVGKLPNQSTVSTTFTTDTTPGLQTFTFGPQFTNLTSVSWNSESTFEYVVTDPEFGNSTATDYQSNQFDDIVLRYGAETPAPTPPPTPPPVVGAAVTVGAGPDTLVLQLQQDAYQGNAQYTVSLDGVQVGAIQVAQATRASGTFDTLTVRADLASGSHRVTVNFLNDLYNGTAATDRNLYVTSGTYNGAAIAFTARPLLGNGATSIEFSEAAPPPVTPPPVTPAPAAGAAITVGAGSDTLVLKLSQDAYQGSAQYTVAVDGVQAGGVLTASATRASGLSDTLTILGNLAPGAHNVEINFLNDAYGGTAATDRNLYVTSGTYNGEAITFTARQLLSAGPSRIDFQEAPPPPVPGTPPVVGAAITVGTGSDTLVFKLAQDAYNGNAQYTVSLDGAQVGGTLTASATRASGLFDTLTVRADLAAGPHRAAINFLNDAYGGTAATDRNLFVDSGTYNGDTVAFTARQLLSAGPTFIDFQEAAPAPSTLPPTGASTTVGTGSDVLVLQVQQDAYQGNAQYTVSLDGTQVGGVLTASATRASGLFDTLTVRASLAAGPHRATVNFLNDAYAGTAATDRNLYVASGTYNGGTLSAAQAALLSAGPVSFSFTDATG